MTVQEKKQDNTISSQPDAENTKKTKPAQGELTDQELDKVAGGRGSTAPSVSEIVITKNTDVATGS